MPLGRGFTNWKRYLTVSAIFWPAFLMSLDYSPKTYWRAGGGLEMGRR